MLVDFHGHAIPESFLEWLLQNPHEAQADVVNDPAVPGGRKIVHQQGYVYPLFQGFYDRQAYAAQRAEAGITFALRSPPPPFFFYWLEPRLASSIAYRLNEGMAELQGQESATTACLGSVPLQDPEQAARELEHVVRLGMPGVLIGTDVEGVSLASERFRPFWEAADALGAIVYLHPYYVGTKQGLEDWYLTNLLGNPWSTTLAATHLCLSGLLDRYQRVRVVLAHGGGFFPYQVGRLDHGYGVRPETRKDAASPPSAYLRRFYYDTLTFHPKPLAHLVGLVGADRVLMGSDYPFDMAEWPPTGALNQAGLTAREMEMVRSETALSLLDRGERGGSR